MKEEEFNVKNKRGKWSKINVPHKGWHCFDIEDQESLDQICEMCESQSIRYIHYMKHENYPEILTVGCICAGYMEENLIRAKSRDSLMRSRTSKRKRFLSKNWKIFQKGNYYIKTEGFIVTIFPERGKWKASIKEENSSFTKFSRRTYIDQDSAKLAAFDAITAIIFENEKET